MAKKFDWVKVDKVFLESLDAGAKKYPLSESEMNDIGIVIRGPFIVEPTSKTSKEIKSSFPSLFSNLIFFEDADTDKKMVSFDRLSQTARTEVRGRITSSGNKIYIRTPDSGWGDITIRALTENDLKLFEPMLPPQEKPTLEQMVDWYWNAGEEDEEE